MGTRPVYGGTKKFQEDPHWRDHLLFYEYFHGDNGAGYGASHQTGWTGLVGALMRILGALDPRSSLKVGKALVLKGLEPGVEPGGEIVKVSASSPHLSGQHPCLADGVVQDLSVGLRRWMTFRMPSWTAWRRWASTGSGSCPSGRPARPATCVTRQSRMAQRVPGHTAGFA